MSHLDQVGYVLIGIVAIIYSSAGFGGGSSYLAIMALMNLPFETYPTLALICNLIVVFSSTLLFIKNKLINWKKVIPWILFSIPSAFLGGLIHLPEKIFLVLLSALLFWAGIKIVFKKIERSGHTPNKLQQALIGVILGLVSGLVGIGGGIFLSPVMTYWNMEKAKNIAITTTLFIFFNSLAGLVGKLSVTKNFNDILKYWPILLIVFIGGQIGNRWCVYKATDKQLTTLAGVLSIIASCSLFYKYLSF